MSQTLGCRCGAVNATEAAYLQMTRTQQLDFRIRITNCQTCRYDTKASDRPKGSDR